MESHHHVTPFYEEKLRKNNVTIFWIMVKKKTLKSYSTAAYTACPPLMSHFPFIDLLFVEMILEAYAKFLNLAPSGLSQR